MSFHHASYTHDPCRFVPEGFEVPLGLEFEKFRLRMLSVADVEKDFDAVMESRDHLVEKWGDGWPDGLTLEQNLVDLGWHQKEFQRRHSFAYTVVAPDESRVLGCVYIYPSRRADFDAEVYLWARQSELVYGLESDLEQAVRTWIQEEWPFRNPAFPGMEQPFETFERLPMRS